MKVDRTADPGDATDGNGGTTGSGSGGTLYGRKTITVNWSFPANAPAPTSFTVVIFTGTDPTNTANYLINPVEVLPTDRSYQVSIFPRTTLSINAAVRANYA